MAQPASVHDSRAGYQKVSARKKWALFLVNSGLQTCIDVVSILLALLSVVIYVVATYILDPKTQDLFHTMNFALSIIFLAHYLGALWLADSRSAYILSYQSLIDVVTIVPGFTEYVGMHSDSATFLFLRGFRMVRVLRVLRLLRGSKFFSTDVHKRLFYLAFTFAMMVFCSAGFFYELEKGAREAVDPPLPIQMSTPLPAAPSNQTGVAGLPAVLQLNGTAGGGTYTRFYFHEALYWSAVTIATVGYGDISPITKEGQVMVLLLLFFILSLLPYQTSKLLEALSATNPLLRASYHNRRRRHVLLMGSLDHLSLHTFVHELYHPDRGYQHHDTVLLRNDLPDRHIHSLLRNHKVSTRLTYAQGSPHTPKDLARVSAQNAKAIFVLADQGAHDPALEDTANIMMLLATGHYLQRYHHLHLNNRPITSLLHRLAHWLRPQSIRRETVNAVTPEIPHLFIQLLLPESHHQLCQLLGALQAQSLASKSTLMAGFRSHHSMFWAALSADLTVVCVTELRQALLGASCLACPGVVGLVSNLSRTANAFNLPTMHEIDEDWFKQYQDGSEMEVYPVPAFPPHLHGQPFALVALFLYQEYHSVLLGTVPQGSWAGTGMQLAPFEEVIAKGTIGLIIASDHRVAKAIAHGKLQTFQDWWECSSGGGDTPKPGHQQGGWQDHSRETEIRCPFRPPASPQRGGPPLPPLRDGRPAQTACWGASLAPQIGPQPPQYDLPHMNLPLNMPLVHPPSSPPPNLGAMTWGVESPGGAPGTTPKPLRRTSVLSRLRGSGSPILRRLQRNYSGAHRSEILRNLNFSQVPLVTHTQVWRTKDLLRRSHRRSDPVPPLHLVHDTVQLDAHILVLLCSPLCVEELVGVVCRLRTLLLQRLRPIVIVAPELLADKHFESLACMEDVWFLLGDPKSVDDLQRAGAERASKALLLGGPRQHATGNGTLQEGALADAEVIFAFQHLKTLNRNLEVYCQVVLSTSAAYLGPSLPFIPLTAGHEDFAPQDTVVYAAGCVLLPEVFANITCQAFYSAHFYPLIQQLLSTRGVSSAPLLGPFQQAAPPQDPPPPDHSQPSTPSQWSHPDTPMTYVSDHSRSATPHAAAPCCERSLVVVPVDLHFLPTRTYGAWFEYCLQQRQLLCLGLYRSNTYGGSTSYFVYTNPPPDVPLYSTDRAFVVASVAQRAHLVQGFAGEAKPGVAVDPAC